jgi:hypothetical protein
MNQLTNNETASYSAILPEPQNDDWNLFEFPEFNEGDAD